MVDNDRQRQVMGDLLKLLPVLVLAFYIAFIPHQGYPYPLHIDEWNCMTYAKAIMQTGGTTFADPFTGQWIIDISTNFEAGYHIFLGILQQITGLSWLTIFKFFPGIIFMITVLSVYILASREGYGWEAAFFTCLIPTSIGILGPSFMVPLAMGLLFIPLSLFLVMNYKTWASYLLLFIFYCFLLAMHPPSAFILFIILIPCILLNLRSDFRHSLGIILALVLPFVALSPWIFETLLRTVKLLSIPQPLSPTVQLPQIMQTYGYLPIAFSFLGIIFLFIKGRKKNFGLILGLLALLLMLVVFFRFHYGLPTLYERGLTYMVLMLSIIAGAGLMWVRRIRLPDKPAGNLTQFLARNLGNILCIFLIGVTLVIAIPSRLDEYYYHMIDQDDYRAFAWIKDHVNQEYNKTILDPWKATPFTAITQRNVYRRIFLYIEPLDNMIYQFLQKGCRDTRFLRDNEISLVYNRDYCDNPNLITIRDGVYLVNPSFSRGISIPEILYNGGFWEIRDNRPAWWDTWEQNCTPAYLYPEPGRNGVYCAGISMSETEPFDPWPMALWGQNIPVESGKSYRIGGWIRTENISGQGGAMIVPHWKGPRDTWIGATEFMNFIQGTNGWTYFEAKVTAPPGSTYCTVGCLIAGCSGTAWFDDIIFEEEKT